MSSAWTAANNLLPAEVAAALQHAAQASAPLLDSACSAAQPLIEHARPYLQRVDGALGGLAPWQCAAWGAICILVGALAVLQLLAAWARMRQQGGLLQCALATLRGLPGVRGAVQGELHKIRAQIKEGHAKAQAGAASLTELPAHSSSPAAVLAALKQRAAGDVAVPEGGHSPLSGAVYMQGGPHKAMLDQAYALFSTSNPLHPDVWPSVRRMEAEVVAMTVAMLGGGPGTAAPGACGAMTSGGTESILLAVKAARDWARRHRRVTAPEMVVGPSAHAAYWKAAEYFEIRLVVAPLGRDYRLHGAAVRRRLSANTVLVVASAPGFPHGVVDDVEGIAAAAAAARVACHVDCCLGGFVLPFARKLGYPIPPFDLAVHGVTSLSVDTHKFAQAHKGTSVVVYRDEAMRACQFTRITNWTGGLYISPGMAGSRPGALVVCAWAALVALGEAGLLEAAWGVMEAAAEFQRALAREVPALEVVGRPDMCVVAFKARRPRALNVYALNDLLTARGWHLNALQFPPALHFCFTAATVHVVEPLVSDIRAAVQQLLANPKAAGSGGSAPVYGMSGLSPDRGLVGEVLLAYQAAQLEP